MAYRETALVHVIRPGGVKDAAVYVNAARCLDEARALAELLEPGTVVYLSNDDGAAFRAVAPMPTLGQLRRATSRRPQ